MPTPYSANPQDANLIDFINHVEKEYGRDAVAQLMADALTDYRGFLIMTFPELILSNAIPRGYISRPLAESLI